MVGDSPSWKLSSKGAAGERCCLLYASICFWIEEIAEKAKSGEYRVCCIMQMKNKLIAIDNKATNP